MTFFDLILRNLWKKKARSIGLLLAVAVAVMTVVALDVTSSGLEQSAAAIISIGKADFTVAQKGASSTLTSTIDRNELARIQPDARGPERRRRPRRDRAHQRRQSRVH